MALTPDAMRDWCASLLATVNNPSDTSLVEYLKAIPALESLENLPSGTPVLVRGDVDAKPGDKIGKGDIRLRSMVETLQFGRQHGWKQVIFGHIGRKPEGSLAAVARRLGELLECDAPLVDDWLDENTMTVRDTLTDQIGRSEPGSVLVLDNIRRYQIERALWDATSDDLPKLSEPLARFVNELSQKVARHYVNESLSAGSLDTSSTVVPAGMERVALGQYVRQEFAGPMMRCLETQLVVFSGLKIDKLDDLEAMIGRGKIRWVFSAGSLAMALKKAAAELDGASFNLGVAEDPSHSDKPYYTPPERIEQAKRMVREGRDNGIEFVLPVDFILADGSEAETLGPGDQQLDVGPKTSELFEKKIGEFLNQQKFGGVVFHNGVFGMFEDPRFEKGTRRFVAQLRRLTEAGAEVYIGGGEGGKALEQYGQPEWVTHVFTAGGTVLNALGNKPVPYLAALKAAAQR
ncbi:MAG: phosphoglycerate kinase [Pirellulales bacterium]